jgi:hypothetical protein
VHHVGFITLIFRDARSTKHGILNFGLQHCEDGVNYADTFRRQIKIYRTIIFPVVLYGCETWSLTLREERRLRVFENRMLRVFGPKRDEVTREWRKLKMRRLMICIPYPILCGWLNREE